MAGAVVRVIVIATQDGSEQIGSTHDRDDDISVSLIFRSILKSINTID
jgi:hypothetical protein